MSDQSKKQKKDDKENSGLMLKQIRESKGLSLTAVHEATKIPMDALRAIEEGYTVRTLSSFYRRGFIKMYAQYLGIDVSKVIDDYEPEQLPEPVSGEQFDTLQERFDSVISSNRIQMVVRILIIAFVIFAVFKIGRFVANRDQRRAARVSATQKAAQPVKKVQEKRTKVSKVEQKTTPTTQARDARATPARQSSLLGKKQAQEVTLSVRAERSGWLRVVVDGMVVFQSNIKRGSVETWAADKTIELSGRNINYLEFEHNGKMLGLLSKPDRKIKRVIFTKGGFSVKE